jgi:hypothetical protein
MNRTIAFALLLAAAGCSVNKPGIELDGRASPSDPTNCLFTAGGQSLLGPGVLDVNIKKSYRGEFYLKNDLLDPSITDTNTVKGAKAWHGNAVKVRVNPSDYIKDYTPSPALLAYSVVTVLPVNTNSVPPQGADVATLDLIPVAVGNALAALVGPGSRGRVVLGITIEGETLDGQGLDTNEFFYPVDICNGCLAPTETCTATQVLTPQTCDGEGQDFRSVCK